MKTPLPLFLILFALWMTCCSSSDETIEPNIEMAIDLEMEMDGEMDMDGESMLETNEGVAEITDVSVSGEENQYSFNVTISSPDLGCQQYADWWEIIDLDGNLLNRRILAHSHVDEQPFTRLGEQFEITSTTEVYIRAHMNTTSYGAKVFKGSISDGFLADNLDPEFAKDLEEVEPLPSGCAF